MTTLKRVVAGGLAGMLAKSVVAPVDRVKILFQVTNETFSFKKVGCPICSPIAASGKLLERELMRGYILKSST